MRPRLIGIAVMMALVGSSTDTQASVKPHYEDAPLHAVQFVDREEGWAVGDDGVIWHTIDGGQNWERQSSGVRASLRSLYFFNSLIGWIVGREELPSGSVGVVLFTKDGGVSWRRLMTGTMPGLNLVRFANERIGYLAGDGTGQHPSGVFGTEDGGQTWKPVPGPACPSWLGGAMKPDGTGALAGAWNRLAIAKPDRVWAIDHDPLGGRHLRGMHFQGGQGFAVGQGGLVLVNKSGNGAAWDFAELPLPHPVRSSWDFHAVHGVGQSLWIAGRPGSAILHSPDLGKTWTVLRTGQPLPLNSVFFLDEKQGWAVGELGIVLTTTDGGQNWKIQKRGGQHAAVLFIHAHASNLPLDVMAHLGGSDGYLTAALSVTCADPMTASSERSMEWARTSTAVRLAGGASSQTLWAFPLSAQSAGASRTDILKAWDSHHGDRAAEETLRQLVLALRMWRPYVVVTDLPEDGGTNSLVGEALREAFGQSGNKDVFPEQLKMLGLEPFSGMKLYAVSGTGEVNLDVGSVNDNLEGSPRDLASGPVRLLGNRGADAAPLPRLRKFKLLAGPQEAREHRHLMQGIQSAHGGLSRRPITSLKEPDPEVLKAAQSTARLSAMIENPSELTDPNRLLSTIGPTIDAMPVDQGARACYMAAAHLARSGHWELAREVYLMLVDRFPVHPLTIEAYRWLISYNSSSEARRRLEMGQFMRRTQSTPATAIPDGGLKTADHSTAPSSPVPNPLAAIPKVEPNTIEQMTYLHRPDEKKQWLQDCLQIAEKLSAHGPLYSNDPAIQLCLQATQRKLGELEKSKRWLANFVARTRSGPWHDTAASELWLINREGPSPRPVANCKYTDTKPFLDGRLTEPCWEDAQPWEILNSSGDTKEYPTEVRLAYDAEFLYIALRCSHPAGKRIEPVTPREHDADLRKYDRVSLFLDLDRDYNTCFHLQVDQRGCVTEDCWGDRSWNPRWFVAVQSDEEAWTIEAALPLTGMTSEPIKPGTVWACNAVRAIPAVGTQAFSLPAGTPEEKPRGEGFGLLLFTRPEKMTR